MQKSFCTTREAADLLGVSIGTVQLWVEKGLLNAWKTDGGHRRVERQSIEKLLHKPNRLLNHPSELPWTTQRSHRLKIMVVDDDPELLHLYQTVIRRWTLPCDLLCIDNAVAALLAIGRHEPDMLITDLQMPDVNGFEMLRVLEKSQELASMRVVAVSGLDVADIESRGGVPAGVAILPKPVPFERLLEIAAKLEPKSMEA